MLIALLFACTGTEPTDTSSTGDGYSLVATEIGDGVLLSAWSDGPVLRMVGGQTGGGAGMIAQLNGDSLCVESSATEHALWWIYGARPGEWYAVGEKGTILHSVDSVRTREDVSTEGTLFGTYDDGQSVWAVGGDINTQKGEIWRKESGGDWTPFATDLDGLVFKVWEGWFVGEKRSYQLVNNELVPHETPGKLLTIRGRDTNDVWAVGGTSAASVVHWEVDRWVDMDSALIGQPLNGVWTAPGEPVWIVGNYGTVAYREADQWVSGNPVTGEHFHAVWQHLGEMYFVGGNLFSTTDNYGTIGKYGQNLSQPLIPTACAQ